MKRFFVSLLAVVMVLSLVACSQPGAPKNANTEEPVAESPEAATESVVETAWPERPIELIVPFGAGGDNDFNARAYAEGLSEVLGQPIVVTNIGGGGGSIGARQVKDSDPDGYTVMLHCSAINVNEALGVADFGIDDFDLACVAAISPGEIICARADTGWKTLKDMYDYAQTNGGVKAAIQFGTMVQLQSLMLNAYGFNVTSVDCGDSTERVTAVLSGEADYLINSYGAAKAYIESGDFVALANTNSERCPEFADIPTSTEQGYDIPLAKYYFFAFPKDTPDEIVNKFAAAVKQVQETDEYADTVMKAYAQTPFFADSEECYRLLDEFRKNIAETCANLLAQKN